MGRYYVPFFFKDIDNIDSNRLRVTNGFQPLVTCSKLIMETPKKSKNFFKVNSKDTRLT